MVLGQASGQTSVYESRLWLLLLLPALGGLLSGWLAWRPFSVTSNTAICCDSTTKKRHYTIARSENDGPPSTHPDHHR